MNIGEIQDTMAVHGWLKIYLYQRFYKLFSNLL